MNIFKKIAIFNKVTKIIKEVKKYFETTTLDDELKDIIKCIVSDFERLIKKVPETKEAIQYLIELVTGKK